MKTTELQASAGPRIERLPSGKVLAGITAVLGFAFFFEAVDSGTINYFLPVFAGEFNLRFEALGALGTMSNVGVLLGTLLSGIIADRFGRKSVIIGAVIIWGVAGVWQALVGSLEWLIVVRIAIGLGIGLQLPATITLLAELVPSRLRARYLISMLALFPLGMSAAGLICYLLIPVIGWRGVSVLESVPALTAILIWKFVPESPVWLEAKGRHKDADIVMTMLERKIETSTGLSLPQVDRLPVFEPGLPEAFASTTRTEKVPLQRMFSKEHWRTTLMLTLQWPAMLLAMYGLQTWFSMVFVQQGISIQNSIGYSTIMTLGGVFGAFLVPWLLKKYGRKPVAILTALLTFVVALAYGSLLGSVVFMVIFGMLFNLFAYALGQVSNTYTSELWPTSLRSTGVGYANSIGRLGAIAGPILLGFLMSGFGVQAAVFFAGSMYAITAITIWVLGRETQGTVFTAD
ncbi:MFS transporter [Arthrobacter sp. 8AJ]|uniref:MFS transporter n=1 Tax=Arthrobacter sp. 8AJ TaxID=2653130 RepID=UPI0012F0D0E9|nr:MFS transporter [Arthrobacter sp. 8AJ]VXC34416.1 putative MFS transporter, metabolite:H+ symporter [Arthrobacter sp. 8AJ]